MAMHVPWTDEEIKIARDMFEKGKSFTVIGAFLGRTRNAIAGLANRLHFSRPVEQKKVEEEITSVPPKSIFIELEDTEEGPDDDDLAAWQELQVPVATNNHGPKSLIDLEPNDCRWPIGDEDFVFCAKLKLEGHPYCPKHFKLAYTPRKYEGK
jgi:hypothetical protein